MDSNLVKELRQGKGAPTNSDVLMRKAADRITELEMERDDWRTKAEGRYVELNKAHGQMAKVRQECVWTRDDEHSIWDTQCGMIQIQQTNFCDNCGGKVVYTPEEGNEVS